MNTVRPHEVIVRPLVTEKGVWRTQTQNVYTFEVHPKANKIEIARAVAEIYGVTVLAVRTMWRHGKPRRVRLTRGRTRRWKRAEVKLDPDDRIEVV
ncbi:MAG: hypothetical protein AMS14_09590 [Planctomycetes bacterium DG_20]|nr:MAG: hypothetical protein AMS14_09590 [Planctomycetes bacterium DG_20]